MYVSSSVPRYQPFPASGDRKPRDCPIISRVTYAALSRYFSSLTGQDQSLAVPALLLEGGLPLAAVGVALIHHSMTRNSICEQPEP